jgi:capsular exopolysaccharide synthesis family protein
MDLRRHARALRRRLWLLVLLPAAATLAAAGVSLYLPPVYQADVGVLVRPAQPISSLDQSSGAVTADQVARTYAQLLTQRALLQKVIDDLRLHGGPDQLRQAIRVTPQANTTLLTVAVSEGDPGLARDVANKLVEDFLAQAQDLQRAQVDRYAANVAGQVQRLEQQIQDEQARIDELQAETKPLSSRDSAEVVRLQQQITADRARYFTVLQGQSDIEVNVARSSDDVTVVSPATRPGLPVSPKPLLNAGLAAGAGLVLAVCLALLLDHLDQSIKTDEDLIERTGLVPLSHVPLAEQPRSLRTRTALDGDPAMAEPYKTLRTNVLFSSLDRPLRTIAVTSAIPGEGKSTVAAHFATALAAAGHATVLLDCDFRRPAQHRIFGRIRNVGLTNLILGEVSEAEAIQPVERLPGLWLTTTGPTPANPSELLGSARMRELLEGLIARFRYVVIDTPPVNAVADPLVVASYADATLMVVEHGRATFPTVKQALRSLSLVQARVLGAVMNKVASSEHGYHYYRYSTNGDGPGGDAAERKERLWRQMPSSTPSAERTRTGV